MNKKALGVFLMGTLFLFGSCIDDTYDVANKKIDTDMQLKGNKLALPLGSFSPIVLDSILVDSILDSIPFVKVDSESRVYSISLNDSLKESIPQDNLEALRKVSALRANIEGIKQTINEIGFKINRFDFEETLNFGDVKLTEVKLPEMSENIDINLDELTLEPININVSPEKPITFNIPTIELDPIKVGENIPSQEVNINIPDINLEGVTTPALGADVVMGVPKFEMPTVHPPKFFLKEELSLEKAKKEIENALALIGNPSQLPLDLPIKNIKFNEIDQYSVKIEFGYTLPKDIEKIEDLTKIVFEEESSKVNFVFTNPTLLKGQSELNRTIKFEIAFPSNYKLATDKEADVSKYKYELINDSTLSAEIIPGDDPTTEINLYLTEIALDFNPKDTEIKINDVAKCKLEYIADGNITLKKGTALNTITDGLNCYFSLDVAFELAEVWGSTKPVSVPADKFQAQELKMPFTINGLDYITSIDKIELNPSVSKICFTMDIENGFGAFDLDKNSYIVLKFPDEFNFAEQMILPEGLVSYDKNDKQFKISSLKVFDPKYKWELPIIGIDFGEHGTVIDGTFKYEPIAVIKAVTDGQDGVTIGGATEIDLMEQTDILFKDHKITLSAPAITLGIVDVQGSTKPIKQEFESKSFALKFDIEGELEHIESIDYVQFDTENPITIKALAKGFDGISFAESSGIALKFPEMFTFADGCSLDYNKDLKAFVIDDFSKLTQGPWKFPLKQINIGDKLSIDEEISMFAIQKNEQTNIYEKTENIYVGMTEEEFSLKEMRDKGLLGDKTLEVALGSSEIAITNVQVDTKEIDVPFESLTETYNINLDNLPYITRIGSIVLDSINDNLTISPDLIGGGLGRFELAQNSYIELIFPEIFKFNVNSSVPGVKFVDSDSSRIQITRLSALGSQDWNLEIERIAINEYIKDHKFNKNYDIQVIAHNAEGGTGSLTVASIDNLTLSEIQAAGGERQMNISVKGTLEIEDVDVSTEEIEIPFTKQAIGFPIDIPNSDLIDSIKYISFDKEYNTIPLSISMKDMNGEDGTLSPFDLAGDSKLKITFPEMFVLGDCDFGELEYNEKDNAIYINSIEDITNCEIKLALDTINIYQKFGENFELKDSIYVTAMKDDKASDKLYIAGNENLKFSQVSNVMGDKEITFGILPGTTLKIDEAVVVSTEQTFTFEKDTTITIDETIKEAIKRVDFVGFADSVPLNLTINTEGLDSITATLNAELVLPPVFKITSGDKGVTIDEKSGKISINKEHTFQDNAPLAFTLWVHNLDFASFDGGGLALTETKNEEDKVVYQLKFDSDVSMKCTVSIDGAKISSKILEEGVALVAGFDMERIVLKDFKGIYGGTFERVSQSIPLGIEDAFSEMKENGLTLANTKPELMISLYNSVGVPVDVDLSIVGKDSEGNVIDNTEINPGTLHIKPAQFKNGTLVADTTYWLFTSNKEAYVPDDYERVEVTNLDSLLTKLPNTIDFSLVPTIVTEGVDHRVDLSKPIEVGGSYSISMPFDLQFAQSIPLGDYLGEEIDSILSSDKNNLSLANPQLALTIYNPIAQELSFDLSLIGKNSEGAPIEKATIFDNERFTLAAGTLNKADSTITPTPTRWLFAVSKDIKKEGFDSTEVVPVPALSTLLEELPHKIDVALNAHLNTNLLEGIDYNNDLDLQFEYDVIIPLQFNDLRFNYTDTISGLALGIEEMLEETGLSISNVGLGIAMNLKNTLPIGLTVHLTPLDAQNNVIEGIEIGDIELPAGDGSAISNNEEEGKDVELSIKCDSPATLSTLEKIAFSLDVASGNGDNALAGKQGIQIRDIVLQIICDVEMGSIN